MSEKYGKIKIPTAKSLSGHTKLNGSSGGRNPDCLSLELQNHDEIQED